MNKKLLRFTAAALCISLLLGSGAYAAFPSANLRHFETALASNVILASNTFWRDSASDKVTENYITYKPNQNVKPLLVYGSKLCNYGNFEDMAQLLEKRGYSVIAGVNGDYYNMDTYQPLGIVITDGKLISSDDDHYAVGFRSDGTAVIGSPKLNMSFTVGSSTYPLYGINKVRTGSGFYLFTEDFSYTTKSKDNGTEVICSIVKGDFKVNSQITLKVESVVKSKGPVELPAGKVIISLSESAPDQNPLKLFVSGALVTVNVSCEDTRWNSVQYAAGALYKLVTAGKIEGGLENKLGPRTAVGTKPNGEIVLYTVDGRQSGYSVGASIDEVAERMLALGCTEACLLDGGGSTTMGAKFIGDSSYTVINSPSDGRMRYVTQFIMLAGTGSGEASIMGVYPYDRIMLAGTKKTFSAGAADKYGNAKTLGGVNWSVLSGGGSISGSGEYTAGAPGDVLISASSGSLSAKTSVKVVSSPDSITLIDESGGKALGEITLEAGQSLNLSANAVYNHISIDTDDTDFKWYLSGGVGTVDADGKLTAGSSGGTGTLTVSAGTASVSIPVTVKIGIKRLEDFEGGTLKLSGKPTNASASLSSDPEKVRFGKQSLEIKYDLSGGSALIPLDLKLPDYYAYVSLWIYGDGSGNTLKLLSPNESSESIALDFVGWKQFLLSAKNNLSGIQISGKSSGKVWADQILALSAPVTDTAAPSIVFSEIKDSSLLVCGIWDDYDGSISYYNISVYCDGKALEYDYQSGQFQSYLPALDPAAPHRVTVCAWDTSGNLSRYSIDIPATASGKQPFADMSGHWSEKYVSYLYSRGAVSGVPLNGSIQYQPDEKMTREQLAVIMARYLGTDLKKYEDAKPAFADLKDISDYALPAVRAMYSLGIIKGFTEGDKLCFKPGDPLTRAQAMTIIARTLPGGYKAGDLTGFLDASQIPDWAARHVSLLMSIGAVSGSSGMLNPGAYVTRGEIAKMISMMY